MVDTYWNLIQPEELVKRVGAVLRDYSEEYEVTYDATYQPAAPYWVVQTDNPPMGYAYNNNSYSYVFNIYVRVFLVRGTGGFSTERQFEVSNDFVNVTAHLLGNRTLVSTQTTPDDYTVDVGRGYTPPGFKVDDVTMVLFDPIEGTRNPQMYGSAYRLTLPFVVKFNSSVGYGM